MKKKLTRREILEKLDKGNKSMLEVSREIGIDVREVKSIVLSED